MRRDALCHIMVIAIGSWLDLSSAAHAGTLAYGVDAGVAETDNVTLVPTDQISQTIVVVDADFDYKQKSARLDADAKGDFSYLDYLQGAYHGQLRGRFDGNGTVALVQDRLTWTLQDDYGQAALDPFTPVTPINIETINYFATGPNLNLRLGGLSFLDLTARVARTDYEVSTFTNNRVSVSAAWGLRLSALSSVSLNLDSTRALFENTVLNTDFDRTNLFVNYALQAARTEISADVGATKVSATGPSTTGGLVRLKLSRTLSPAAKLSLTASHFLTDASTSFANLQGGASGGISATPSVLSSENYTSNYASLAWQYQRNRTTLGLSGRLEKDIYGGQPALDNKQKTAEFHVARQMTRSFLGEIAGHLYQSNYGQALVIPQVGSSNTTTGTVSAGLTWRYGRGLEIKLQAEHTVYSVSSGDTGYRENRAYLTVGYRPLPPTGEIQNTLATPPAP